MDILQTKKKLNQLNTGRTERQKQGVQKWKLANWIGILLAATGYGKTNVALLAIKEYKPTSVTIVVPTLELQLQWQKILLKNKVENFRVLVINTAATMQITTDMLVIDECHRLPAETFRLALQNARYKALLMLTATMIRADGEHKFLLDYAKVIDKVTVEECLKNGWISNYTVYNLAIDLTQDERYKYIKAQRMFEEATEECGGKTYAFKNAQIWLKQSKQLTDNKHEMRSILSKQEYSNWLKSNEKEFTLITNRAKGAIKYYASISTRKNIIYNAKAKLLTTAAILGYFPTSKALVFSLTTEFADSLQEILGDICVTIHSKMTKKKRQESLRLFNDNRTKKKVISSVKALNSGLDIPECELGIAAAATSSKIESIQSLGRIVRAVEGKHAIMVNIYVRDTQEFTWLRNRQFDMNKSKIKWIYSVSEILKNN